MAAMKEETFGAWNIYDLTEMAQRRLPKGLFEFMHRGNDDEIAVRDNRIVEIKSPLILQPGPAALTDGLDAIVRALRPGA